MPKPRPIRAALIATLLACQPATAFEADLSAILRPDDRARLEDLDRVAGQTLRRALALSPDAGIATGALSGAPLPPDEARAILPGEWACRTIKLGGNLPLIAYQPFRCLIDRDGHLEKLSGSQRTRGQIGMLDGRLTYLGTSFIAGDTPVDYVDLPRNIAPSAMPQIFPDAGLVEVTGTGRARILLPRPYLESDLNILLLER